VIEDAIAAVAIRAHADYADYAEQVDRGEVQILINQCGLVPFELAGIVMVEHSVSQPCD
jgi:hypothetical protein